MSTRLAALVPAGARLRTLSAAASLALGAAWLAPWLARPLTWRLIDLGVAVMMFSVAAQLVLGSL